MEEYALHWPYRTDDGPKLFGYRRNEDGAWVTWGTDEEGVLWSAMLGGLGLFSDQAPWLRLRNMAGERLLSAMEVVEQADREAAARRHADTRTTQEAVARREAEAEVARLRAWQGRTVDRRLPLSERATSVTLAPAC